MVTLELFFSRIIGYNAVTSIGTKLLVLSCDSEEEKNGRRNTGICFNLKETVQDCPGSAVVEAAES